MKKRSNSSVGPEHPLWRSANSASLNVLLNELRTKQGNSTSLISIYVARGTDLNKKIEEIEKETATALNIRDKKTRKDVVDALKKIIRYLKTRAATGSGKGLALFSGDVNLSHERQIRLWTVDNPPEPILVDFYTCGKSFQVEILENMLKPKIMYGLILIDNREASIAVFLGDRFPQIEERLVSDYVGKGNPHFGIERKMKSYFHGRTRRGGSKAPKISRIIEGQSKSFMKRVAETAKTVFMPNGRIMPELKGILVGGPAMTNHHFANDGYLHPNLRNILIAVEDVEFCDESGMRQLIIKAADKLADARLVREMQSMNNLLKAIITGGNAAYGEMEVENAMNRGTVKTLLLSEELDAKEIERLVKKAETTGATVEVFSIGSEPGCQLWRTFAGRAALLDRKP